MKVIYVDIDETICHRESSTDFGVTHDYTKAMPIQENIEKINKLYDEGIRAVPIAEAMTNLVLMDHFLRNRAQCGDVEQVLPFNNNE